MVRVTCNCLWKESPVDPLVVEDSNPIPQKPSCSRLHLAGMKMTGRIFDWRAGKDVGRRKPSSPRERCVKGQQSHHKCPRISHKWCHEGSSGCGPHNTPPEQKKKNFFLNSQFLFCFGKKSGGKKETKTWISDTSSSGQHAHSLSWFLQQV